MEKLEQYIANFDYEYDLYEIPITDKRRQKLRGEFEYLFLFQKLDLPLYLHKKLSHEFIVKFNLQGRFTYRLSPYRRNIWGKLQNIDLERRMNSKLYSVEIENRLKINVSNKVVVSDRNQLELELSQRETALVQSPFLFSGFQQFCIKRGDGISQLLAYPLIVANYLNRVVDFGCVVQHGELKLLYVNLVNQNGQYRGSLFCLSAEELVNIVAKFYCLELRLVGKCINQLYDIAKKIAKEVQIDSFQFDSLLFFDNEELRLYPLVEINYRMTMGTLFNSIISNSKLFNLFLLVPKKNISQKLEKFTMLSPERGHMFHCYNFACNCNQQILSALAVHSSL